MVSLKVVLAFAIISSTVAVYVGKVRIAILSKPIMSTGALRRGAYSVEIPILPIPSTYSF